MIVMIFKKDKLFCEINPTCYEISRQKEILKRHIKNMASNDKFSNTKTKEKLPNLVASYSCALIKKGKGIDPVLQKNKAINISLASSKINGTIVHPGEVFSFWKTVGKTSKRKGYKDGRVIIANELRPGLGGGLCNLGNTIHYLILHSPLEVIEFHKHSDALVPDYGKRIPFSTGTSVSYNNLDYRFKNNTDQDVQLVLWVKDEILYAELRSEKEFPYTYELVEEGHHFQKEKDKYFRVSKIYKETIDKKTNKTINKALILNNHSEVMYDYALIPKDQIREEISV